jgi:uncharacterized protein YegL
MTMRRLPVYLVLDTSGSMSGEPIEAVRNGVQTLVAALRQDPQALESAYISVITFDSSARQVVPLTELAQFQMPDIQASGTTAMGEALQLLATRRAQEVVKSTPEKKGDWKPLVFLLTDGQPTDDLQGGLAAFNQQKWGIVVPCAVGTGADTSALKLVSESVVALDTADSNSLKSFFKWVSSSIATSSKSVNEGRKEITGLDQLPPPPPEVNVVS